jgi:competence protein ComFB
VKNVYEEVVVDEFERLKPTIDGFCDCAVCRQDVLAYALNRLPPRYVVGRVGEMHSRVNMQRSQEAARVVSVMIQGFQKVKAKPKQECAVKTT